MNSRAVHLEVAKSLETDDFILLLMRFLNRRGHVRELRSDNGTNFVGADREIKEAVEHIDDEKVRNELLQRGCKWVFHPSLSITIVGSMGKACEISEKESEGHYW